MKKALAISILVCASSAAADDVVKRPLPDYTGRGESPTTAGDVLIWVPRVAVAPLYLASEYVVRRPMEALVVTAERGQWPEHIRNYVTGPIGIIPTGLVDLGLRPTVGFYFWWNDAVATDNQIRATGSFGADVVTATLLDRFNIGDSGWQLSVRGALSRRSDTRFYGIGPDTRFDNAARYEDHRIEGSVAASYRFGGLSLLRLEAGMRRVDLGDGSCCGDPSIPEAAAMGWFALPPGFAEGGYRGPFTRVKLVLDSRDHAPATGVALALEGEQGSDPGTDRVWLRAGATLSGAVEVGKRRVASLILHATIAEPLEGDDVPFTELATLGGSGPLPGFAAGRLLGRSAVAATLQYEWPVWAFLTGIAQAGAGDVFGEHFDGFEMGRMRGSVGMGVRSVGVGDHRFELLVALGTSPFNDGMSIDSVRIVFGGVIGF
jgi:hypothetical protein